MRFEADAVEPAHVPSVLPACVGALLNLAIYHLGDLFVADLGDYQKAAAMLAVTLFLCLYNSVAILRANSSYIWSPLPWFLFACAVHCGIGPMIYFFGSDEALNYVDSFYPVDERRLLRTCYLNSVGVLTVCASCYLVLARWPGGRYFSPTPLQNSQLKRLAAIYLGIGLPVRYLLAIPYEFGLTDFILPGAILSCSMFVTLGLFVMVYLACSGGGGAGFRIATIALGCSELFVGLLTLSKTSFFLALFVIMLGIYLARPRLVFAVSFVFVVLLAYSLISPFVTWARSEVLSNPAYVTLSGRFQVFQNYLQTQAWENTDQRERDEGMLTRLNMVPSQSFAMDAYDAGNPGHTFALAAYVLIPRILWSDKPILTPGREFTYLVTGRDHTANAPGVFAEAYWNGGWALVVAACTYVGILYAIGTRFVVNAVKVRDFRIIPLAFFGLLMGLRIEDWFVACYFQSIPICVAYSIMINMVRLD